MEKIIFLPGFELEIKQQSEQSFRARILYSSEDKLIQEDLGTMYGNFLTRPTTEDASPYWSIHLFYATGKTVQLTKEIVTGAMKLLKEKKVFCEPALLIGQIIPPFESSKGINVQMGRIFPDDPETNG